MASGPTSTWPARTSVRIVFPVALTVALFAATIFFLFLPMLEERLLTGKREMIRELTQTAWSALDDFERQVQNGRMTRTEAQARAVAHLRALRYGPERKDYFWINDMHPRLLMHPYRRDLEGSDIATFADPTGKRLFVECVAIVAAAGAGYVDYHWQWKDDPAHIVPKISYVKGFAPWGWIVGTGVYVEDLRAEMAAIRRHLILVCAGILALMLGLSGYIVWQGVMAERRRRQAQEQARQQQEQLYQAAKLASIGTLVSGIAHEINNPIASIVLNAQTLEKTWRAVGPVLDRHLADPGDFAVGGMPYGLLRERLPRLLSDTVDAALRARSIVADLKDFARQGTSDLNETVDVNASLQRAACLVANLIRKSTRHFTLEPGPGLPAVKGNAQRLEQVMVNLLVNACQALGSADQAIRAATALDPAGQVVITVSDEGRGVPENLRERIKDPFFTTKRDQGGTGLGLAISERIVADHGGRLDLSAEAAGRGTVATVVLPAFKEAP